MTVEGGSQNENSGSAQRPGKAGGDATQQQMTLKTPILNAKAKDLVGMRILSFMYIRSMSNPCAMIRPLLDTLEQPRKTILIP